MKINLKLEKGENIFNDDLLNHVLWFNNIKTSSDYQKIAKIDFPFFFKGYELFNAKIDSFKNKKVIIIGDYDADGVCATSIMIIFLRYLNIDCDYIIGDRNTDGYGINTNLIDEAIKKNADVIITVDNGIKSKKEVDYAISLGLDVIVTDHHEVDLDNLPNCLIFNPHYNQDLINEGICGAFTALVLCYGYLKSKDISDKSLMYELYELAAIATIADVMPLYNFNSKLVKNFISRINKKDIYNEGLNKLLNKLKLNDTNAIELSYKLIPLINAPGRLSNASIVVDLFINGNNNVQKIFEINEERRKITKEAIDKVVLDDSSINVIYIEDLNEGILGIVAGNITDKTKKPTFVFTNNNGIIKGSARSVGDFDILEATTNSLPKTYLSYGGHKQALGLSFNNIDEFNIFRINLSKIDYHYEPTINLLEYRYSSFKDTYNKLTTLEPFGSGLVRPLFYLEGFIHERVVIQNKHTTFKMKVNNFDESFIAFNKIINSDYIRFSFDVKREVYRNTLEYKGFVNEIF